MPRFAVLQHDSPQGRHWDFMLETREALATWALAEPPDAAAAIAAEVLPDHRTAYLDYEGPVSEGRGSVTRWDRGTYQLNRYEADEVVAVVAGEILIGEITLRRSPEDPAQWTFSYVPFA
jgi:hypothetical protein